MLDFKKMTIASIDDIRPYLNMSTNRFCDFSAGGLIMWRNAFSTQYAIYDGALYIKLHLQDGRTAFTVPLGKPFRETYKNLVDGIRLSESAIDAALAIAIYSARTDVDRKSVV